MSAYQQDGVIIACWGVLYLEYHTHAGSVWIFLSLSPNSHQITTHMAKTPTPHTNVLYDLYMAQLGTCMLNKYEYTQISAYTCR